MCPDGSSSTMRSGGNMKNIMKNQKIISQNIINIGCGIVCGAALGILIGQLFIDGYIAEGLVFGASLGLIFGVMMSFRRRKI